jgi:hypothetical protein
MSQPTRPQTRSVKNFVSLEKGTLWSTQKFEGFSITRAAKEITNATMVLKATDLFEVVVAIMFKL